MSKTQRTAYLFPGQGAFIPGALQELRSHPDVAGVFADIDAAVSETDGGRTDCLALEGTPREIDELLETAPGALQTSIFGLSVAVFTMLRGGIGPSDVLVGHSLGEVAALTCAGAFSVADGARIVQARTRAAARTPAAGGGMLALSANAETAAALVQAADDPTVAVAAHNAPRQTVLSGTVAALARVQTAATALGIGSATLKSPFAFHNQLLSTAVTPLLHSLAEVRQRPLQFRVYSPITGQYYRDDDDIPGLLAAHLVRPVHFMESIRLLHAQNFSHFVECGARDALTSLARHTVPDIRTIACLTSRGSASAAIEGAIGELGRYRRELASVPSVGSVAADGSAQDGPPPRNGFPVQLLNHSPIPSTVTLQAAPAENSTAATFSLRSGTAPTPTSVPAPDPAPTANVASDQLYPTPAQLLSELRTSYAKALDYPESVFTEDADLEADLGVDSVKQAELLARVTENYALNTDPADFRLAELSSLGKISAFVLARMGRIPEQPGAAPGPATNPATAEIPSPPHYNRAQILDELRATYAAALDYPTSVFAETADLEADLGVDSVKQTELLAQVSDHYALAIRPDELPLTELTTLGSIADLVLMAPANRMSEIG